MSFFFFPHPTLLVDETQSSHSIRSYANRKKRIHNRFTSSTRFTNNQNLIFASPSLERTHAASCTNSIAFDHRSIGANLNLILYF
ncbi:MAG: hypothetical protein EBY29_05720 [Planctomycetes bacterium]|nr:hypothetical protein [Planctomycetota bacterium]